MCQIGEPVKPVTTCTPKRAAARAVSLMRSAARERTPSGSPSPHTSGGRIDRWRSSIGSQTAWPTRWLLIAQQPRPWRSSSSRRSRAVAVVGERARDVEVVAPGRELEPVEPPLAALGRELGDRHVGPLAGEQRDGARHGPGSCHTLGAMTLLDRFRLDGKVAIVTGASSGLGVAFADGLAEAGADVAICARRADRLEETTRAGRGARPPLRRDRGRRLQARGLRARASSATVAELGRVDVLVNNAGVGTAVPATRETPEQFRQVIDINLNGSYWMAQAFARAIGEDGGSIVNIGSVLGSTTAGLPQAAYASSKAAIIGLTRDLAQQWTGRKEIRVNALAPGFFPSEMTDQYPDGYLDAMMIRVPAGRGGEPGGAHRRAAVPRLRRLVLRHRRRCCRSTAGC